jgi:hypothetical protein
LLCKKLPLHFAQAKYFTFARGQIFHTPQAYFIRSEGTDFTENAKGVFFALPLTSKLDALYGAKTSSLSCKLIRDRGKHFNKTLLA